MVGRYASLGVLILESLRIFVDWLTSLVPDASQQPAARQCTTGRIVASSNTLPRPTLTVLAWAKLVRRSNTYARGTLFSPPVSASDVSCLLQLGCVVAVFYAGPASCVCTNEQTTICLDVLGFGLIDFWYVFLVTYSFKGGVCLWVGNIGRRQLAVMMTLAL